MWRNYCSNICGGAATMNGLVFKTWINDCGMINAWPCLGPPYPVPFVKWLFKSYYYFSEWQNLFLLSNPIAYQNVLCTKIRESSPTNILSVRDVRMNKSRLEVVRVPCADHSTQSQTMDSKDIRGIILWRISWICTSHTWTGVSTQLARKYLVRFH